MRLIGALEDAIHASRFAAYLITAGIPAKAEETSEGNCEIWVHEEDQFGTALEEFARFQADTENPKYAAAVSKASKLSREEERKRRRIQKKIVVGTEGLRPKPRLTITLIALCVIVALLTDFGSAVESRLFQALEFVAVGPPESKEILLRNEVDFDRLDVRLASIKRGELWRLVTPMFIHHGTVHLLFNMMWLFQLGSLIERRYGWQRMAILVLLTAAVSNFIQCTMPERFDGSPPGLVNGTLLSFLGGMSGVVYGLLGFVWMKSVFDRSAGFYLSQSTLIFMIGWMVFCMVPGLSEKLLGINVANWAHAIGLIMGIVIGYFPVWIQQNFRS